MAALPPITVLIDSREKTPLPFPARMTCLDPRHSPTSCRKVSVRVVTKRKHLETADYVLADEPGVVYTAGRGASGVGVVETKRSIDELAANCLSASGRRAFSRMLARMREAFLKPYLIVEGGLHTLAMPPRHFPKVIEPGLVVDALLRLTMEADIPVIPLGTVSLQGRRRMGEYVARMLLNAALAAKPTQEPAEAGLCQIQRS